MKRRSVAIAMIIVLNSFVLGGVGVPIKGKETEEQRNRRVEVSKYIAAHGWRLYFNGICRNDFRLYLEIVFKKKVHEDIRGEIYNLNGKKVGRWVHTLSDEHERGEVNNYSTPYGIFLKFFENDMEVNIRTNDLTARGFYGNGIKSSDCLPKEKRAGTIVVLIRK